MKKLLSVLSALLLTNVLFAASANKMTMVTYFPVKYVAYSQVDVTKQMDIGLTSACQMNLGCATDEGFNTGKSLRVNNLLKIAGGKLELNDAPAIVGSTAIIGSGNGTADFDFETNLRVRNYKQGYTLQADNMYLSELNLFGYKFPACSGETMSWQKLKLKNKDEVYLVCGTAETSKDECTPTASYAKIDEVSLENLWDMDSSNFCIVYNKNYKKAAKYSCPSNLTEKKECIDYYYEPGTGDKVEANYYQATPKTKFTIPNQGEVDYSRQPSNIRINTISVMEQYLPRADSYGDPYTGYMPYNDATDLSVNYGPGDEAVIQDYSGTTPSYRYASGVNQSKFEVSCKSFGTGKEPGRYLMYTGGIIDDNSGDWYIITAGVCVVKRGNQYYKGNVVCCPK